LIYEQKRVKTAVLCRALESYRTILIFEALSASISSTFSAISSLAFDHRIEGLPKEVVKTTLMLQALMRQEGECLHHKEEDKFVVAAMANVCAQKHPFDNMSYLVSGSTAFSRSFIDDSASFNGYPVYCSTDDCSDASNI